MALRCVRLEHRGQRQQPSDGTDLAPYSYGAATLHLVARTSIEGQVARFSPDRRQAIVEIAQLAVGEDLAVQVTATEDPTLSGLDNPLRATSMSIRAFCRNCVGVAEL